MNRGDRGHTLGSLFEPWIRAGGGTPEHWQPSRLVAGLAVDSRRIAPHFVFFARPGLRGDGAAYVDDALRAGAIAVVTGASTDDPGGRDFGVPTLRVAEVGACLGDIADRFYAEPSRTLRVVGITGTNGKTSVAHYVAQALTILEGSCGIVGTLGQGIFGEPLDEGIHTTPDVIELHERLARFVAAGARYAAMEVSSHGLEQGRVHGMRFDVVVLTNFSRDHLDFHHSEAAYRAAKRRLFDWPDVEAAVINADDAFGAELLSHSSGRHRCELAFRVVSRGPCGITPAKDAAGRESPNDRCLSGEVLEASAAGLRLFLRSGPEAAVLNSALVGHFNVENLLAALGVLLALGCEFDRAVAALEAVRPPPGRMEPVALELPLEADRFQAADPAVPIVIVDFAHTPDALQVALDTLRPFACGALWCVFGCGGERDQGKRRIMGDVARRSADHVVVTSDNPRSEAPGAIIGHILEAWEDRGFTPPRVEIDRGEAIRYAVLHAAPEDLVLIAGKGHETHQIVGAGVRAFDDRVEARAALAERVKC